MVFGFKKMIYRFVRRTTRPITMNKAEYWKSKLALVYMITAWNALGFTLYYIFTGRDDWAYYYGLKTEEEKVQRPGEYYTDLLGMKNVHVYTIEGFRKVGEYEVKGSDKKKKKNES